MALQHVWITRGPNAGHILQMTEADASAAIGGNWALDKEINLLSDEEHHEMMAEDVDWDSYQAYRDKVADPTYSAQAEDEGSWVPPTDPSAPIDQAHKRKGAKARRTRSEEEDDDDDAVVTVTRDDTTIKRDDE
jgi:hypothetical protein